MTLEFVVLIDNQKKFLNKNNPYLVGNNSLFLRKHKLTPLIVVVIIFVLLMVVKVTILLNLLFQHLLSLFVIYWHLLLTYLHRTFNQIQIIHNQNRIFILISIYVEKIELCRAFTACENRVNLCFLYKKTLISIAYVTFVADFIKYYTLITQ